MLGFNRRASELCRLIPCEEENATSSFRISFKHSGVRGVDGASAIPVRIIRHRRRNLLPTELVGGRRYGRGRRICAILDRRSSGANGFLKTWLAARSSRGGAGS